MAIPEMKRSAVVSPCGRYRYSLRREWAVERASGQITFVTLIPWTAVRISGGSRDSAAKAARKKNRRR